MLQKQFSYWTTGICIYLLIFAEFFHPITAFTQDLGRHLKMGQIIFQTHAVPKTNLFSYTYPNFPFINTHWLSEVIFYLIHQALRTQGLLFIISLVAASAFFLLFWYIRKTNILTIVMATILYGGILLERTDLRPEIFSFLFVAIFVVILYKNREKVTRWLFLLPLIELLWVNMHIYFIIGPLLIGLFLLEMIVLQRKQYITFAYYLFHHTRPKNILPTQQSELHNDLKAGIYLFLIFLLTLLASILNPNALLGTLYPLHVFQNYGYTIAENQSLFFLINYGFRHSSYLYFGIAVSILFFTLLLYRTQTRLIDWLLSLVFTLIAISAIRNFPLFVFATFIPFVTAFSPLANKITHDINKFLYRKTIGIVCIILALGYFVYAFIATNGLGYAITPGAEKATDFFITQHLTGPIFNNFDIGSYLDYRLYPKEKVFVDGRPEAYPAIFFQKVYIPMQEDPKIFSLEDKKYNFQTIFFTHTDQTPWAQEFIQNILKNSQWTLIYLDQSTYILVKDTSGTHKLIQANRIDATHGHITADNLQDLYRLANFFHLAGWKDKEIGIYQKILTLSPTSCTAIYQIGSYYFQKQNLAMSSMYQQKYQNTCQ